MKLFYKNNLNFQLTHRLIFEKGPEKATPSESGKPSAEVVFLTEELKLRSCLGSIDASNPKNKNITSEARKRLDQLIVLKDKAKKTGNEVEINKLIVKLNDLFKPFENYLLSIKLITAKGLERISLKKIVDDKERSGKIFQIGKKLQLENALFVSTDGKEYTLINAITNDIRLMSSKVYSISDVVGKTRNFIQVSINGGKPGFIEEKYFDYSILPTPSTLPEAMTKTLTPREITLSKLKVLPPFPDIGKSDLAFEHLLATGDLGDLEIFKKNKLDQLTTILNELTIAKSGKVTRKDFHEEMAKNPELSAFAEYKIDESSPWYKLVEDMKLDVEKKGEELADKFKEDWQAETEPKSLAKASNDFFKKT